MKNWNSQPEWSDDSRAPRGVRVRTGNHGNGSPTRPSIYKRKAARLAARAIAKAAE